MEYLYVEIICQLSKPTSTDVTDHTMKNLTHLKNTIIKEHHHDTRDVERAQGGVYDVVLAVEQAFIEVPVRSVVEAEHDGRSDGSRYEPY